jgi:hypothetical protein
MNIFQKLLGAIFPPYRFETIRKEQDKLFKAIMNALTDNFEQIKEQTLSGKLYGLDNWKLYPDFKFISMGYGGNKIFKYKKRGQSFKISGVQIFSNRNKQFESIEILIQDNLVCGLKITNSGYQLNEFDINQIKAAQIIKKEFTFPQSDSDIFYGSLDDEIKEKLKPDDLFEIDYDNRTYFSFYELEDGNYLAIDKNMKVYSLIHDAKPAVSLMKISFKEIISDIINNKFDKQQHFENRYKNNH